MLCNVLCWECGLQIAFLDLIRPSDMEKESFRAGIELAIRSAADNCSVTAPTTPATAFIAYFHKLLHSVQTYTTSTYITLLNCHCLDMIGSALFGT